MKIELNVFFDRDIESLGREHLEFNFRKEKLKNVLRDLMTRAVYEERGRS